MLLNFLTLAMKVVRRIVELVVIALFLVMMAAVTAQIFGRYIFGFPIAQAVEISTIAQIWMVLLAAGIAARLGIHVGVDIVVAQLPRRVVAVINVLVVVASLWFLWLVLAGSLDLIAIGALQTTPGMQVKMSWVYAAMPVGVIYLALEFVVAMLAKSAKNEKVYVE